MSDRTRILVEPVPATPARLDNAQRRVFKVFADGNPAIFLFTGSNLADLSKRTHAFAAACPAITSRPLFFHRLGGVDYLGLEFIAGRDLESASKSGDLASDSVVAIAMGILKELETTRQPATLETAAAEIEEIFDNAAKAPVFGTLDRQFLRDLVFPFVRAAALNEPFTTRWTNGDLIARNLMLASDGGAKIVDYEFARRTHFDFDDGWRWQTFSRLPPSCSQLPPFSGRESPQGWKEALCILRQIGLAHRWSAAACAAADSQGLLDRLLRITAEAHGEFRSSVFYHPLAHHKTPSNPVEHEHAQLYWSADGQFSEVNSQGVACVISVENFVQFSVPASPGPLHLRFDPSRSARLIELHSLTIRAEPSAVDLLQLPAGSDWKWIRPGSGVWLLVSGKTLTFLSLNDDPNLHLPCLQIPAGTTHLVVETRIRYGRDLLPLQTLVGDRVALPARTETSTRRTGHAIP